MAGKTLYDKLWDSHLVKQRDDGSALIYIDRHIIHEVTSPQAFEGLRLAGRKPWRIDANIATPDHNVPTTPERKGGIDAIATRFAFAGADPRRQLRRIRHHRIQDERRAPGHRARDRPGAGRHLAGHDRGLRRLAHLHPRRVGALAHGIGTSEVEHVLATSAWSPRNEEHAGAVEGQLPFGVTAKDIVLAVIGKIGTAGGNGHAIEFAGSAIRDLSVEGRMTICNMSIEAGARVGLVAADEKTVDYVKAVRSRRRARVGSSRRAWKDLVSDADAVFDTVVELDASQINRKSAGAPRPRWSWPSISVPDRLPSRPGQAWLDRACLEVHGPERQPGDHRHSAGSRVHRLLHQLAHRRPARRGRNRQGPQGRLDRQAGDRGAGLGPGQGPGRAEGLDKIFLEAGFEWREPGCSMCWR
jgi:3-isopropylmalate/(R)-2-methylmalate dehydratase large subunit